MHEPRTPRAARSDDRRAADASLTLRDARSDAAGAIVLRADHPRDVEAYLRAVGPRRMAQLALDVRTVDGLTVTIPGDRFLALLADQWGEPAG